MAAARSFGDAVRAGDDAAARAALRKFDAVTAEIDSDYPVTRLFGHRFDDAIEDRAQQFRRERESP